MVAMKKFLLTLCSVFLLPAAWAQKNYETTFKLTCGPAEVMLTNTCVMLDETDPFCSRQEMKIFNTKSKKEIRQTYLPKWSKTYHTQGFVAELGCLKNKSNYFIIAESTNYASCHTCVWDDVFDANGRYLGSNRRGFTHALSRSFKKFQFRHEFFNIDDDDRIISRIDVPRTPLKQE
jgi:hypothetical protein